METRALAASKGDTGRIDIGFYTSLSTGPLRDKILQFTSQHPGVEVNFIEESRRSLIALLDRGAIDIIFALGEPNYPDYAYKRLWSDRIMVALPKHHPLSTTEFIYWTDLKNECFLISPRDPGPEIQDILLSKLSSPGDRPQIKQIKANRGLILSLVESNRGITLNCESATGILLQGVVFREVRDGNGPTRVGYVAYWRNANANPALKQFLSLLSANPLVSSSSALTTA
jgi:DNA-binding transcriptional LysR family regulator